MLHNGAKIKYGQWQSINGGILSRRIMIFTQNGGDSLFQYFIDSVDTYKQQYKTVVEGRFKSRRRNKGEKQSDYVADMSGVHDGDGPSHYSDTVISVKLPDGTYGEGKIRISDHEVDPGTFAGNNNVDICISIVVGKVERKYPNKEFSNEREITIIEYVLDKKFENKERVLINIANEITKTAINGWDKNTTMGFKSAPDIKKVRGTKIDEDTLRRVIREEIERYFNK